MNDFVTEVDRKAESMIRAELLAATPDAAVVGEELSPDLVKAGLAWIVDPLDGTTNYLHGYPAYAVSIAGAVEGELRVGVVWDVTRDLCYHAMAGRGAWQSGTPLQVSPVSRLMQALVGTGFPFKLQHRLGDYLEQFGRVLQGSSGIRRAGAAALDLVDVAAGRLDGFWELRLAPWDIAAGTLLVREAGGVVTDIEGGSDMLRHTSVVAGNREVHQQLFDLLSRPNDATTRST